MLASLVTIQANMVKAAEPKDKKQTTEPAPSIRQFVFRQLERAQRLVEENNVQQALKVLSRLREEKSLSAYESAQTWNLTAYGYYVQSRYRDAIAAYNQVLKQQRIPRALTESTLTTLSQLYFVVEEYRQAIVYAKKLMTSTPVPTPDIYLLLGQAYFQLGEYRNALPPLETAVSQTLKSGKQPKENWLLLLRVIYYELKQYDNLLSVLKSLVRLYPKAEYLTTLADVYGELGDTKKQLALMEALYEKDHLNTTHDLVNLTNLYLLHGIPYKAARLLEQEMKAKRVEQTARNLRLLSQAWYQAREIDKSIPPLHRAAEQSDKGELYLQLAQIYIDLERWKEATAALTKVLAKPKIDRPDRAQLMLGTALYNQDKLVQAKSAFERARKDQRSERVADQWLGFLETEIERRKVDEEVKHRTESGMSETGPADS